MHKSPWKHLVLVSASGAPPWCPGVRTAWWRPSSEFRCRPRRESPLNKAKEVIAAIVDSNVFWTYKFGPAKTLWKNIFRCTKKIGIIKVYHLISFGFCIDIFCHVKKWTCHAQPKIDFDDSRWFQAIHGLDCCLPYNVSVDLSWQSYLVYLTFTGTHTHIYI